MPVPFYIIDGHGTKNKLKVNKEGTIGVVNHLHPPLNDTIELRPFRQFFTDDGSPTGSSDMRVNGSVTPVDFFIDAKADRDIYIKTFSFEIADAGAELNEFGNLSELTNGCGFFWDTGDGRNIIHNGLKSNWDIVRLCGGNPAVGATTSSFRANNVIGQAEGYIPFLDVVKIFGVPWGLRLRKGSRDKIVLRVNDNINFVGDSSFNIIAFGVTQ